MPKSNFCRSTGGQAASLSGRCGCGETAQTDLTEDMPMHRYSNPIPICGVSCGCGSRGDCGCTEQLDQILAALACQNQLLVDLLGAVNCLTAALLAGRSSCGEQ